MEKAKLKVCNHIYRHALSPFGCTTHERIEQFTRVDWNSYHEQLWPVGVLHAYKYEQDSKHIELEGPQLYATSEGESSIGSSEHLSGTQNMQRCPVSYVFRPWCCTVITLARSPCNSVLHILECVPVHLHGCMVDLHGQMKPSALHDVLITGCIVLMTSSAVNCIEYKWPSSPYAQLS